MKNVSFMKGIYYFIKDIINPIVAIVAISIGIYSTNKIGKIDLNLKETQKQESISEYDANNICNSLSKTYNDIIDYINTDEFKESDEIVRRLQLSIYTQDLFEGKSFLEDLITMSSLKDDYLNNNTSSEFEYKHSKINLYKDSIEILDPRIVKIEDSEEIIIKELPPTIYKIEKVENSKKEDSDEITYKYVILGKEDSNQVIQNIGLEK